jgi:hypothetical protein
LFDDLPGRRLRQQAWLEWLRIGVRQQELGRAEAELAGTVGDAGAARWGFVLRVGRTVGQRWGRSAARDAREGDLLVAEQQQRS